MCSCFSYALLCAAGLVSLLLEFVADGNSNVRSIANQSLDIIMVRCAAACA